MKVNELDLDFQSVGDIEVERDKMGNVALYMPQQDYDKAQKKTVHQYGWGPFCLFDVDTSGYNNVAGVYLFTVGDRIRYIGETSDIDSRIQQGYRRISPANCFTGGQSTNCRINHNVFAETRNGESVSLWVREIQEHKQAEEKLLKTHDPVWNRRLPQASTGNDEEQDKTETYEGKYGPLYEKLDQTNADRFSLSFEEINELLDSSLPPSAYDYTAWWQPQGHLHAEGWETRGWTVDTLDLDAETVTFVRK